MVVRSSGDTPSPIHQRTVEHNLAIFRGCGAVGHEFVSALNKLEPYAGVFYVEALINVRTGAVEEVLPPSPTRTYERETILPNGQIAMVPVVLSHKHPAARLAVFVVSATGKHEILDVVARDEIIPEARAALRDSIHASRAACSGQKMAA
ncbi:MAG: hypothetical protein U0136_09765 [Bdellovibrionota bacterium]